MSRRNVRHELRPLGSWHARDRKWIANLAPEPEDLERRAHIKFREGEDDLGRLKYAFVELEPGMEVMLLKYGNRHVAGTMVWMPSESDGGQAVLQELLDGLHLTKSDVLSQTPEAT